MPLQDEEIDQHIKLARSLDLAYGQKEVTKGDTLWVKIVVASIESETRGR
jgi:hypothetical protein